jgi:branched-chain amino acid transport system permease protein
VIARGSQAASVAPYLGIIVLGIVAALLPQLQPSGQVMSLATGAIIYAIAGAGLGFLWGQSGQLTLAHASVFGIGAYAAAVGAKHYGLTFVEALPFSTGLGLLAGALIALPSLRTAGHYFVILTFAIGEVITVVEMRLESLTGGVNGITALPGAQTLFGLRLGGRADYYLVVVGFAVAVFLVLLALMRSRWGIILRGMRENEDLSTSLGVNIPLHRILVYAVSGAVAGLAGQLYLYYVKSIAPESFTSQLSIVFLLVVLLGGKAYLLGPLVGSLVYLFVPEFLGLSPVRSQIAFGVILVIMILLAPGGLMSLPGRFMARIRARGGRP